MTFGFSEYFLGNHNLPKFKRDELWQHWWRVCHIIIVIDDLILIFLNRSLLSVQQRMEFWIYCFMGELELWLIRP